MNLRERLIEILYKTATNKCKIKNLLTPVGFIFFLTIVILFIVFFLPMDKFLRLPKVFPTSLDIILSVPALAMGLLLILWSILHFIKITGTRVPFNPPPKVVATGPYTYVRNPMLTGVFIFLLGLGILFRSISLGFAVTPLFILFNVLELKKIEEQELEKRFGEEYKEYKKNVPVFIPWLNVRTKK